MTTLPFSTDQKIEDHGPLGGPDMNCFSLSEAAGAGLRRASGITALPPLHAPRAARRAGPRIGDAPCGGETPPVASGWGERVKDRRGEGRRGEEELTPGGDWTGWPRAWSGLAAEMAERESRMRAALRREQAMARTLHSAFVPQSLPECAGYAMAAGYHPAPGEAKVGGDFYDAFRLPGERIGLLLGDVAGKGLDAAVYAGMARYMARAYALQAGSPAAVLGHLNRALCESIDDPCLFVTAVYAVLDPATETVRVATAGHWPGLLVGAERVATVGSPSLALGIDADARYEEEERRVEPGDGLVFYTDGLVELGDDPMEGLRAAEAVLASHRDDGPRAWVDALYQKARQSGGLRDDLTLLALRREP